MEKNIKYDLNVDEILVIPSPETNTNLKVNANLYNIESSNTKVAYISATSATLNTAAPNEQINKYYIQKTAHESEIITVVSTGRIVLSTPEDTENPQESTELVTILLTSNVENIN